MTSCQWSRSAVSSSSSDGEHDRGVVGNQLHDGAEALDRQDVGDVRPLVALLGRRQLGELAVLGVELGGGGDLDSLGLGQRALGEGGEPAKRLDLVPEELDAHGALLGRRIDVEDAAAGGELAAVVDLLDALVAAGDETFQRLAQVELLPDGELEAVRPQLGVRNALHQRDRARDHDRRLAGAPSASSSASSAAIRSPTRCGGGASWDS